MKKEKKESLAITFKKFLVPISVVVAVIIFFLSYNTYLVDRSLADLKFALDQTARAQNIVETERIGILLDDLLINEMASTKIDSLNIANLEFTKNIVIEGGIKPQLNDVEFLLNKLIKKKEKERGALLLAIDRMNTDIQHFIRFITKELPGGAVRPEIFKSAGNIDLAILRKAREYDANWKLNEAISAYEEFINKCPFYPQLQLVKLRLADAYFRATNYKEAKKLYGALIREAPQSEEARVAEILLKKVENRIKKQAEKDKSKTGIAKFAKTEEVRAKYYELSMVDEYLAKIDKETQDLVVYVMKGAEGLSKRAVAPGVDFSMLEKAKALDSTWMLKEAQPLYEEFIAKNLSYKDLASVKLLLGGVYLKSMQYEKALSYYETIARDYADSNEGSLAKRLSEKTKELISVSQKRQGLIDNIKKSKTETDLAQGYYNLGMVDLYLFDLEKANASFRKVTELTPDTELGKKAAFNIAWIYKFRAKYGDAVAEFSKFMEKYPKDALSKDSRYHVADSYYKARNFEEAAKNFEEFAEKNADSPLSSMARFQAGYTYLYNLHDPVRASQSLNKLKERYSETDAAKYASISLVPITERSYRDYGFILLKEGRFTEAKDAFKKALVINTRDAWAHCGLGTANVLLILFDEGIESAKTGVDISSDEYTHAALAFAYEEKGEYQKAVEEYKISISKNPEFLIPHYNLGRVYLLIGWYDLAIKELKETLKFAKDFAEAHNNLGYAYWYKGRIAEAEFEFKAALSYRRKLVEANYNLGVLYETAGRYERAATYFMAVLSVLPDFEPARMRLERVQKKSKRL